MADVWIKCGQFTTPASGTTVLSTTSKGTNPKGIHCWYNRATTSATNTAQACYGHGFSDGTNHRNVWHMCDQGATDNWRDQRAGVVIEIEDPTTDGTVNVRANSAAMNANDVTIGYANFNAGRLINYVIFGGTDCACTVGDVGADASPVTTLSFTSDLIFFACAGTQYDATSLHAYQSFGVAAAGIQQWANHYFSGDGDLDFRASLLIANQMTGQIDVDFADWKADIATITATGFSWNGSNADHFQFMALDLAATGVDVGTFTKSTGGAPASQDLPDLGFEPMAYSLCSAIDTATTDQPANSLNNNCKMAYGVYDGTDQVSAIETAQDADNTDAHSRMHASELLEMTVDIDTSGVTSSGTAQTITDQTPTVEWNPNSAVADVIGYWAVETQAAPPATALKDVICRGVVPFAR